MLIAAGMAITATIFSGHIKGWVESLIVRHYLKDIEPSLPFRIRDLRVHSTWEDFWNGKISELALTLERDDVKLKLQGPVEVHPTESSQGDSEFLISFLSENTLLEWRKPGLIPQWETAEPIVLSAWVQTSRTFRHLSGWNLLLKAKSLTRLPLSGLSVEAATLSAQWEEHAESALRLHLAANSLRYATDDDHQFEAQSVVAKATWPLSFIPFSSLGKIHTSLSARSLEGLWDGHYVDLPSLTNSPIDAELRVADMAPFPPEEGWIRIGKEKGPRLEVNARREAENIPWKTTLTSLPLSWLWETLKAQPEFASRGDIEITRGTLSGSVEGVTHHGEKEASTWVQSGSAQLRDGTGRWKSRAAAWRNARIDVGLNRGGKARKGSISVERIAFRHWEGAIKKTDLSLSSTIKDGTERFKFSLPDGLKLRSNRPSTSLNVLPLLASFHPDDPVDLFDVSTGLTAEPSSLAGWVDDFCIPLERVPASQVTIDFPRIDVSPDTIEPDGHVRVTGFGGYFEISDVGIYEWLSEVPEIDLSAEWDGIRLAELGPWLKFGRIAGILSGHARDMTWVGPLPTHYDFRVELKPERGKKITFTPRAMRNFVQVVAGEEAILALPKAARFFFFGFPRQLLGGYDVKYAGISAFSSDGKIMIETLDPPGTDQHYILKSATTFLKKDTFSIKLKSLTYPVVRDAEQMRSMFQHIITTLRGLEDEEAPKSDAATPAPIEKEEEPAPPICLPSEFDDEAESGQK